MINRFKPTLRATEKVDLEGSIANLIRRLITDPKFFPYRNCLNCQHFTEGLEYCNMWKAKPPAKVIAFGCSEHDDLEVIPF